jgi:ubiquinone/menaquinone biosynthesis C-methylase UbiE
VEVDAASEGALAGERFGVVTSHFGLSDIDDLEGALRTVGRVLEPGGVFVFSILHPCFPGWGEDAPSAWQPGGRVEPLGSALRDVLGDTCAATKSL